MDEETFEEKEKRWSEERERTQNIFCPYCDTKQDTDTMTKHITYHGEYNSDEESECNCDECGKKFIVNEHVERTYTTERID